MKPIVIFINTNDEKLTLTQDQLRQYLENAYQQGYQDGMASCHWTVTNPATIPGGPTVTWTSSCDNIECK